MQYLKQKPSSNGGMVGDQQQYFGVRGHGIQPFSDSHYARKPRTSNASSVVDSSATAYQSLVNYNHYQEDESANVESNQDSSKFLSISPSDVLSQFPHMLTLLEQREILEYQNVFYFGQNSIDSSTGRILKRLPSGTEHNNYGLDDDRGDYICIIKDHIAYRYELIDVLGKGSFGQVMKVFDHKEQTFAALKIIRNKKRFHHQAMIEVRILDRIKHADVGNGANTVKIHESFHFRQHLCITFELLSMNLYEFIKSNNFRGFSVGLIRRFAIQILKCLRLLQQQRIIHCDLKPENVLLCNSTKSQIKVIDFGSSCMENERLYTYIQSRFYRSPEVILGRNLSHRYRRLIHMKHIGLEYGLPIDMWSLGCILVELLTGNPIFPGENENEQLLCMMEVLGVPPLRIILAASRRKTFFHANNRPRISPNSKGLIRHPGTKSLETILQSAAIQTPDFANFIRRCLTWDSLERIRPDEALRHPWICGAEMGSGSVPIQPISYSHPQQLPSPKYPQPAYHTHQQSQHQPAPQHYQHFYTTTNGSNSKRSVGQVSGYSQYQHQNYHGMFAERTAPLLTTDRHKQHSHFLPQLDSRKVAGGLVGHGNNSPLIKQNNAISSPSSSSSLLTRIASGFGLPKPFGRRGSKANK